MENIKELYAIYGELIVNAEIIQARINEVKRKIAEILNKPHQPIVPEVVSEK
jgi:hypothetical protein